MYVVYNPDFTEHSEYTEGGHKPDDGGKQADCGYIPGQRVLAIIDDVLLPCEVIDPLTEDFLRKDFNQDGSRSEEDFQEYKSDLWDWDWDEVVVRPLVKIKTEFGEIASDTTAKESLSSHIRDENGSADFPGGRGRCQEYSVASLNMKNLMSPTPRN